MKRLLALVLALVCLALPALAEPLVLAAPLTGTAFYPADATEEAASFVYRYSFPQVEGEEEAMLAINECYRYMADDALAFTVPISGESYAAVDAHGETTVSTAITCNNGRFFSVLMTTVQAEGGDEVLVCSAQVFDTASEKPGNLITLPYLLGILAGGESDTWMQDRQTAKADACVRSLVWERIEKDTSTPWLEDLEEDLLTDFFYPEEDFYLDEDGEPVFFLQPGIAAPAEAGLITFSISLEELLDEI